MAKAKAASAARVPAGHAPARPARSGATGAPTGRPPWPGKLEPGPSKRPRRFSAGGLSTGGGGGVGPSSCNPGRPLARAPPARAGPPAPLPARARAAALACACAACVGAGAWLGAVIESGAVWFRASALRGTGLSPLVELEDEELPSVKGGMLKWLSDSESNIALCTRFFSSSQAWLASKVESPVGAEATDARDLLVPSRFELWEQPQGGAQGVGTETTSSWRSSASRVLVLREAIEDVSENGAWRCPPVPAASAPRPLCLALAVCWPPPPAPPP